jgi:hypothetical protein
MIIGDNGNTSVDYGIHHTDNLFFMVPESTEKIFEGPRSVEHMKMGG